ncbi:hypothetical protein QVZ41_05055 [Wenyingzhuangia sp. chi5]|uniref:Uncharacterized protein n=1 Tax=Wenyingzhuangia gilva TaxID=3057677 RepID=A0ABT8VQH2_9FLAO|nr:hypothetical protein [Wenyingzhuangia sp. chi5]MDO3694219.1 hypothetical protein [Wenyingzhuangia sp. chi5]
MKIKIMLFGILIFSQVHSQDIKTDDFQKMLDHQNLSFSIPEGFRVGKNMLDYNWCEDNQNNKKIVKTLISEDESILVGITLQPLESEETIALIKKMVPNYNPELAFNKYILSIIDPTDKYSFKYAPAFLKKKFNADIGYIFRRACTNNYLDKYSNNKIVMISKKGHGFFMLSVLYKDGVENIKQKIINHISHVLKFKEEKKVEE